MRIISGNQLTLGPPLPPWPPLGGPPPLPPPPPPSERGALSFSLLLGSLLPPPEEPAGAFSLVWWLPVSLPATISPSPPAVPLAVTGLGLSDFLAAVCVSLVSFDFRRARKKRYGVTTIRNI
jgi:hypothetical protein